MERPIITGMNEELLGAAFSPQALFRAAALKLVLSLSGPHPSAPLGCHTMTSSFKDRTSGQIRLPRAFLSSERGGAEPKGLLTSLTDLHECRIWPLGLGLHSPGLEDSFDRILLYVQNLSLLFVLLLFNKTDLSGASDYECSGSQPTCQH